MSHHRIVNAVLGTLLVSIVPGVAMAQSTTGVKDGWTLSLRQQPALSVQLPAGWQEIAGEALVTASGPGGETLELAVGEVSEDADFEAYVARVEKALEKRRKQSIPTVFRAASSGLVARLDQARRKKEPAGTQTSLFLYPTCDDGTRTLTIVGASPEPTSDGAPDAWDEIAASVNPCSADAAAELALSPEQIALGEQYLAVATKQNADYFEQFAVLQKGATVPVWRGQSGAIASVLTDTSALVDALSWTAETRPLADALMAAYADEIQIWSGLATVRNVRAIDAQQGALEPAGEAKSAAGRAIRLALGLPTLPQ
ncbi:hypothetical protein BH23CHL8_BH23CHL8_29090 [soil metagenome]